MFRILLASAYAAVATPSEAPPPPPTPILYDSQRTNTSYPLVHQVSCDEGSGTAFRIGPTRFATAAHVAKLSHCTIDGHTASATELDTANDFAILESGPPKLGAMKVSCEGFHTGEWYWSNGYALGLPYQTSVAINASFYINQRSGLRIFTGDHTVIPGMSGGPVMNADGEVVGITNAYNSALGLSFSRALKDTSLCK